MAKSDESRNNGDQFPSEIGPDGIFEREIERQIGPLLPAGQREQLLARIAAIVASERFSGPIAHPRHLQAYEDILPGSADRIIGMAERAQRHNMETEQKIVSAQISDRKTGLWLGFVALCLDLGLAAWSGMSGNNVLAGLLLGAGMLGVIGKLVGDRVNK